MYYKTFWSTHLQIITRDVEIRWWQVFATIRKKPVQEKLTQYQESQTEFTETFHDVEWKQQYSEKPNWIY